MSNIDANRIYLSECSGFNLNRLHNNHIPQNQVHNNLQYAKHVKRPVIICENIGKGEIRQETTHQTHR